MSEVTKNETTEVRSPSERFLHAVEREFLSGVGERVLTNFQRKLIQNYFIKIDAYLKTAEIKRMKVEEKYRETLAFTWSNINIEKLAIDCIPYAAIGLDPMQPNHINPLPKKNKALNKYDVAFIIGYRGAELKAKKYGLDIPINVVVEVKYAKDKFKPLKKDFNNPIESYLFEQSTDLDRGEIEGGFYYHEYSDPTKNKLRTFSKKDIDKRRPDNASVEFWGGTKDKWEYDKESRKNKKVGTEDVEGWYPEMVYKVLSKAAYSSITIDSEKIDDHYISIMQKDMENRDMSMQNELSQHANKGATISIDQEEQPAPEVLNMDSAEEVEYAEAEEEMVPSSGPGF